MRHPAAPTLIAFLLGLLAVFLLWGKLRADGHHEGNPHPDDVPPGIVQGDIDGEEEEDEEDKKERIIHSREPKR